MKRFLLIFISVVFLSLTACDNRKSPTERSTYNSYFVQFEPNEKKIYVGTVTGLSSCKYIVSDYYTKRRKYIKGKWDYMCCLKTGKSNCAEKHRYKND